MVAYQRTKNVLAWARANEGYLLNCHLYHLTLTVPHSQAKGLRTRLYTRELLRHFKVLRGSAEWQRAIEGSIFVVDFTAATDNTAHTHLHVLLIANQDLEVVPQGNRRSFQQGREQKWIACTKVNEKHKKHAFKLERIYRKEGNTKIHFEPGKHGVTELHAILQKALEYILKPSVASFYELSPTLMMEYLERPNKQFGVTDKLHGNAANSPFIRLELLHEEDAGAKEEREQRTSDLRTAKPVMKQSPKPTPQVSTHRHKHPASCWCASSSIALLPPSLRPARIQHYGRGPPMTANNSAKIMSK
jgi:hypothetical protein